MNLSEPFIRRPVATSLLRAALALLGIVAFPLLPVAPLYLDRLQNWLQSERAGHMETEARAAAECDGRAE